MDEFNATDFLEHHGILNQKWGVRRYQNKDGSLTPEGRKRYGSNKTEGIQKHVQKKIKEKKASRKREETAEEKAEREAKKKEDLKEHLRKHPEQLPKYSRQLTREDADEIINNINFDRKLKQVRREEIQRGMQKIKDVSDGIGTVSNLMSNSKNLWNNTAEIYNSLADAGVITGGSRMEKIGSTSDFSVRRQSLYRMSPEDVLKNKNQYSSDELKAYANRQKEEENINKYTASGKQNNKNNSNANNIDLDELADKIADKLKNKP